MRYLDPAPRRVPFVGLANGPVVAPFVEKHLDVVDYVEVPFEQFRHQPSTAAIQEHLPVVLHCASLSVAGFTPPSVATVEAIAEHAARTRTPWIGEHLAFISAAMLDDVGGEAATAELSYTICPQLSEETVERTARNLGELRSRFDVPIILENSPQYFEVPGSTMTMPSFVAAVAARCDVDLLVDLTHLLITARNMGLDPLAFLHELPLERVVEVHVSGLSEQAGRWWDDHSLPAPEEAFDLLASLSSRASPRAVTLEYNWAPTLPETLVGSQIERVRATFGG